MHSIESKALQLLKSQHNISPSIYARYIDDVIMGPFDKDFDFDVILRTFNGIDENIEFTLEVPKNLTLNFLDISITVKEGSMNYKWFEKEIHSGISLRSDSYVPNHIKNNYVNNSINYVKRRCSNEADCKVAFNKLETKLSKNGFSMKRKHKKSSKRCKEIRKNNTYLKLGFVNDKTDRDIRKLIKKYELPINLVSSPNKTLYNALKFKQKVEKHESCLVCESLPNKMKCTDRFLVYKFTCHHCKDFYIGQTSRPFKHRFNEHKRAVDKGNVDSSAMAEHCLKCRPKRLTDFDLEILDKCKDALDTRLTEARYIKQLIPKINRRKELTIF